MADETVKVIRIEVGDSPQTVKGLKEEINSLRDALLNTEKGSEDYKKILEQLIDDQKRLADAMNAGKKEAHAAEGSYNALVTQMAALKKVWRETTDEVSRKELGKQISEINTKLKDMDASVGDYRRQVGDYANAISSSFSQMGGAAKGMVGPLSSVKAGLTAISSHPVVAVLTALAAILINGIAKGFKSSEENTNKLREAFSGFQAIGDAVTTMFQKLAGWIANVANAAINLADKLGLLSENFKKRQEMTRKQIELEKKERDLIVTKAEIETEAAELRAKASDEDNYSISQRIQFLQEAQVKEEENLQLEKEILEQKIAQLEAQIAINGSSAEELTKLNELKAKVIKINGQIADSQRNTNKQITALRRRALSEQQQANQARLNLEKDLIQQEYDLSKKGSEEQLRLAKELRKKELDIQLEGLKAKIKNVQDYNTAAVLAIKKYNQDVTVIQNNYEQQQNDDLVKHMQNMAASMKDGSKEQYQILADAERERFRFAKEKGAEFFNETEEQFNDRLRLINNNIRKFQDGALKAIETETALVNQLILDSTKPMSQYYRKQMSMLYTQIDGLTKYSDETITEFNARHDKLVKEMWLAHSDYYEAMRNESEVSIQQEHKLFTDNRNNMIEEMRADIDVMKSYYKITTEELLSFIDFNAEEISAKLTEASQGNVQMSVEQIMEAYKSGLKNGLEDPEFQQLFETLEKYQLLPDSTIKAYYNALNGVKDTTKVYVHQIHENWASLADQIGKLMSSIGDIYSTVLENRKKNLEKEGKYNDQERKNLEKQYKTVQAVKIAEATINTINGALAALTSPTYQSMGAIGAAIAAVQAAAVTAAGVAEIMKIKQTNPYSDSSSSLSSGGGMSATVTPTVSDFEPSYTTNLTGRSDTEYLNDSLGKTNLWVSVTDINDAQERGRVRLAESSF